MMINKNYRKELTTDVDNEQIQKNFGERVEQLRKRASMTQGKLCKRIGISTTAYANYLHGVLNQSTGAYDVRVPNIEISIKICEVFNVSLDYLYGRDDCTSVEHEYIHEVTGLSDKALKRLKNIKKGRPEALYAVNRLLEYSHRPVLDRIGTFFYYDNANLKGIVKSLPSLDDSELIEQISYDMSLDNGSDYELYIYDKDNNLFPVSIDMALFEDIKDQLKDIRNSIRKNNDF